MNILTAHSVPKDDPIMTQQLQLPSFIFDCILLLLLASLWNISEGQDEGDFYFKTLGTHMPRLSRRDDGQLNTLIIKHIPRQGRSEALQTIQIEEDYPEKPNDFFLKSSKSVPRIDRRNDFFLKAAKSVPRIGRRNDFFLKAAKSVPRIGRRNDFFIKAAKSVPRIGRRDEQSDEDDVMMKRSAMAGVPEREEVAAWPWYRNQDMIPRVIKKVGSTELQGQGRLPEDTRQHLWIEEDSSDLGFTQNMHKEVEEPRVQAEV